MSKDKKSGKSKGKANKKPQSGKMFLFVFYGLACAVGGVYFDRHLLSEARVWVGDQAQQLRDAGTEQKIVGFVERADLSPSERKSALSSIDRVYAARRAGRLSTEQARMVLEAEAPFVNGARIPSKKEVERSVELMSSVADDV